MNKIKSIIIIIAIIAIFAMLTSCEEIYNRQIVDTVWNFDYAIISMPNGEIIEENVQSWLDFENSDQIQIRIDGVTYLTHISNAILIKN